MRRALLLGLALYLLPALSWAAGCAGTGNCFWILGTGTTSTTTNWATTSGGGTTGSVPTSVDNCIFDSLSSATAYTVTIDVLACKNISTAAPLTSGNLTIATGNHSVTGNVTWYSGIIFSGTGVLSFIATSGTQVLTSNGATYPGQIVINGVGTTVQLFDNLTVSAALSLTNGTLDVNGKTITGTQFLANNANTRGLTCGTGSFILSGTGNVFNFGNSTGALTLSCASGSIKFTDASSTNKTFNGGSDAPHTFGTLWFTGAGTGTFTINGSNTFSTLKMDTPPHTIIMTAATTQTITTLTATGTAGNLFTFQSSAAGSSWGFTQGSATTTLDYVSLKDSVARGGFWNAGCHSTSVSGNRGWVFCDINPSPVSVGF